MAKGKTVLLHTFKVTMSDDMAAPKGHEANKTALDGAVPDNVVDIVYVSTKTRRVDA